MNGTNPSSSPNKLKIGITKPSDSHRVALLAQRAQRHILQVLNNSSSDWIIAADWQLDSEKLSQFFDYFFRTLPNKYLNVNPPIQFTCYQVEEDTNTALSLWGEAKKLIAKYIEGSREKPSSVQLSPKWYKSSHTAGESLWIYIGQERIGHVRAPKELYNVLNVSVHLVSSKLYEICSKLEKHKLKDKAKKLERLAYCDTLTQIPNRRAFEGQADAMAKEGDFTFIIIDIDHFKQVNDTHWHQAGDDALVFMASRLKEYCNKNEPQWIYGRFGWEEFVLMLPYKDRSRIETFANGLRQFIASEPVVSKVVNPIQIEVSIGVAESDGSSQDNPQERLTTAKSHADKALYVAKHRWRNQVVVHSPDLDVEDQVDSSTPTERRHWARVIDQSK